MKNKPIRHKDDNTFKFQPFAERISNIDIDIFHRVAHPNEDDSEGLECYFYQNVEKWNVLNLTEGYEAFRKEFYGIITLPQLLYKKQHVVDVLLKHLKLKNPLSLQPILEGVVALAKDLRKEFYPFYPQILNQIVELLNTKNTEILEWTFTCLAYLFKFLWRYLIRDIGDVFLNLLPLLSENKPPYINNFAAESFSFVARKVKDRETFLSLILKTLKSKQDGILGCGKLLFEVIHGVSGNFHSCSETILPFYFESLCNESLPQEILFSVLQQVIENLVKHIQPRNSETFWKSVITSLDKSVTQFENSKSEKYLNAIESLIKLTCQTLEYKEGRMLNSPDILVKQYLKLITSENLSEKILFELSNLGAIILISGNINLSQEIASSLIRRTLLIENKTVVLNFIDKLTNYSAFEPLVLPNFLKYYAQTLDPAAYRILTKLILEKSPIAHNGINLLNWKRYSLDFTPNSGKIIAHLLSFIIVDNFEQISDNFDNFVSSLICIPHVNSANHKAILPILKKDIEIIYIKIEKEFETKQVDVQKLLFLLLNLIECVIHISDADTIRDIFNEFQLLNLLFSLLESSSFRIASLRIIDIFFTTCKDTDLISFKNLQLLHGKLSQFFSSPFHQIRLLTSHIYSLFDNLQELQKYSEKESWKVFTICYEIESIEPMIHTYRDQLQNLQKLAYDKPQAVMCQKTEFNTIPLQYFLGVLYMNFQLLWKPTIDFIESYAHGMQVTIFWNIFSKQLYLKNNEDINFNLIDTDVSFIVDLYSDMCKIDDKPDFMNYRILLWKAMAVFPDVAGSRSKDISPLFLSFIEEEYRKSNINEALTWNIKQNVDDDQEHVEDEVDDEEMKDDQNEASQITKISGKANLKTLLTCLSVFSKMHNPKSMYREPELYKLYLELLNHRNPEIQKLALDCIMVYKHKYLTPYKENLYSLIDDKKFKKELTLFRIDKETTVVQEEHRDELIPIVMRIVYSKMFAKTGLRTGSKSSGQLRRSLVLRFLAGCHESEMTKFIHMSFKYYSKYLCDDYEAMIKTIIGGIDLEKFISPKRLQSTLNLVQVVLEQFGGLMGNDLLSYLLKIVLVVGAEVVGAFKQKSCIHSGYLSSLKNIRTMCQNILGQFFARFDSYCWTEKEINAIFDVFVWPWLDKFSTEGIHSPTALLKLFYQWSVNPRYFVLLVKHESNNPEQYPLPHIINLLLANKIHPSVTNMILEIIEKLLHLKVDENESVPPIKLDNVVPIASNILRQLKLDERLNYGSCILLPFVPQVLERLNRKLKNKNKGINQRELFILSRISELVWEPETCDIVLNLVLPMVVKKAIGSTSDDTIFQLVTTAYNLIKNVKEPHKHLRKIAPLFCEITSMQTRKLLVELIATISETYSNEHKDQLSIIAKITQELNAYNKKWLDQPDFERRQDAFKLIENLIAENSIQLELGVIIIFNCFYLIRNENDLALRESSRFCLRTIIPHLAQKYKNSAVDKEFLINEVLFQLIRRGFKSKNEHYRYEAISLLGYMARECSDVHVVLRDLALFANKVDLEVDIFENLLHLQLYRQARALNKFNQICATLITGPNPKTLTLFVLPLVSSYLLTDRYSSKNSLIDSAIDAVKNICHMLPWHHYEGILRYYLGQLRHKLDYQRQLVRLTVAILDAYHFDISKAKTEVKENKKAVAEIQKIKEETQTEEKSKVNEEDVEELEEIKEDEPDIDEILENAEEQTLEDIEEIEDSSKNIPVILRETVLCPSTAKRVLFSIKTILLPQLNKTMAEMTQYEGSHKVNRKKTGVEKEEEELQKVPVSLAVVKLLQKLPTEILERNLPGVFMKLCTFLKSRLDSVRRVTRETLQKIMATLGPKYLGLLISEMSTLLSRGFQVHVLVYTIHSILTSMKESFKATDIDKCLLTILDLCKVDLFGHLADEKEVVKIASKVSEAKSTKSYDTFQILAECITEKCLMDLLLPLKDILSHSHSHKIVTKVQECLRRVVLGLVDNKFISIESLLVFAYGTASESIPQFIANNEKPKLTETELEQKAREKSDCFIIPKLPVYRSGARVNLVKNSAKANAHFLVEFGLKLCFFILKREKLQNCNVKNYIDPFVVVFKNCLSSRHVKMCTITIQCLSWILKFRLPSLENNIKEISDSIFELLHKYAAAGLSKGDNFDLVVAAFKCMAILVREVKYYKINTDQLKVLLLYAEQDLHDYSRQATAFALLKAILTRNLILPEIHDVMQKVAELSVTSDLPHVRLQCRQVFHQFLMDYPLGKKLSKHVSFYLTQLNYELQPGRESALEMVYEIINSFPLQNLQNESGMFFVMLGARLANDESPECRKMVAKCLQTMLEKLPKGNRNTLFDMIIEWMKDPKISHRRLAAQLCGLFIAVEKASFSARLPELTPLIKLQFSPYLNDNTPGKFVRLAPINTEIDSKHLLTKDHHLFQVLQMLLKLCSNCPTFLEQIEDIEVIAENVQTLLAYPHEWVRIGAAQFIGYVLTGLKIDYLANLLVNKKSDEQGYLYSDPENVVKSLTLDLCDQLQPGHIKPEMAEQIIKNLVFIARVLQEIPINSSDGEKENNNNNLVDLFWLTKRMRKIVNREIVEDPKSTILRTEVFKWIAGVISTIDVEKIKQVLHHLFAPLIREMATTEISNAPLRQLAREVAGLLKKKIGKELYLTTLSQLQLQLNSRRAERKRERLQLAVTNPEILAKKKIKLQEKKKEAKKRKIDTIKGRKSVKKRRKEVHLSDSAQYNI